MKNTACRIPFVTTVVLLLTTIAFVGASSPVISAGGRLEALEQDNPIEMSEESVSAGRQVYGRFCRACHGLRADGSGMTAPPGSNPSNLVDDEWDHGSTDAEIFKVIKEGVGPAFDMDSWDGKISDDDIWNVINFLRDLASS